MCTDPSPSDLHRYHLILSYCEDIEQWLEEYGIDRDDWYSSRSHRAMILMPLAQIGEAVSHFKTDDHQKRFPSIPWRGVRAMRNFLIHEYEAIDLEECWKAATVDVPELRKTLLADSDVAAYHEGAATQAESLRERRADKPDMQAFKRADNMGQMGPNPN